MVSLFFSSILLFFFLLLSLPPPGLSDKEEGCFIKAIYSFGDSIADTGNLLRQGTVGPFATIASLPYGRSMNKSTGRCSDGLLMIDYLAMALNLSLLNPYLDSRADFGNGVNFAVAGATAMNTSFFLERGIVMPFSSSSLSEQLDWFQTHLKSICSSKTDCAAKLERALFMVGEIGGNDYNYAFFQGTSMKTVMSFVPFVVQEIIDAAKEVMNAGALQLVIPGNFPIGCMPSYLSMFATMNSEAYDEKKCLKSLNSFSMYHNKQLQSAMEDLRKAYPSVLIMYADYYQAFINLLDDATNLGFDEKSLLKACCGRGLGYNFDIARMCGSAGTGACDEPDGRVSWDGIHLTQEAYKIMAQSLMMTGGFTYPNYGIQEKWKCY